MKRQSEEIAKPAIGSIWTTVDSAKTPYRVEYECIAEVDHFGAPYFKMRCVKSWMGSEKVQGATLAGDEMEVELPWFKHRGAKVTLLRTTLRSENAKEDAVECSFDSLGIQGAITPTMTASKTLKNREIKAVITSMIASGDAVEDVIHGTLWNQYRVEAPAREKALNELLDGGAIIGKGIREWDDGTTCPIYALGKAS